ncbi:MAG: ComF family protein [Gammaproteobacteria bacterium]|jgi:ComF family protein
MFTKLSPPNFCLLCKARCERRDLDLCNACLKDLPSCDDAKIIAPFLYAEPIDRMILALKFGQDLKYARLLGKLLTEKLLLKYQHLPKPEVIIPIPLHKKRLAERGYNQALEIARYVGKEMQIRVDTQSCERAKNTLAQSSLSHKDRKNNISGAFKLRKNLRAKHVVILDDVTTTGNTVTELSETLKCAGAARIDVWCVCKTLLSKD